MIYHRALVAVATATLFCTADARRVLHKHEAAKLQDKRQAGPPMAPASRSATTTEVLTYVTPSPGASPVPVTEQSQIVTSYVPQYTLCELPPLAFGPASPMPSASAVTAPYQNYSISIPPGNGTCTTIYSRTRTMVCATTLSDLISKYTVSSCNEELTFSTQYGAVLATPQAHVANSTGNATYPNATAMITPAPTIQTLTTYYIAPWQELTAGTAPGNVDLKVCATYDNGTEECIREYQSWVTSLVTITATSTTSINLTTTIQGPSQLIVETFVANVTELLTTFSMSTTMETEYETETETTHVSTKGVSTGPTQYQTVTVDEAR